VNYRLVAVRIGDLLKYSTTVNEVERLAFGLFRFQREYFPNEAITSVRAKLVHDWILTLAKQSMSAENRDRLLVEFCRGLVPSDARQAVDELLCGAGVGVPDASTAAYRLFADRGFHPEVVRHCAKLFQQGNYFHAVFEAAKAYNKAVKDKSGLSADGHQLMMRVWDARTGVLKRTACATETDINVQDGLKFLSAGLMQAIRNPTAHEPALLWPIDQKDCLDILGFIAFLFRQLDSSQQARTTPEK